MVLRTADCGSGTSINGADTIVFKEKTWLNFVLGDSDTSVKLPNVIPENGFDGCRTCSRNVCRLPNVVPERRFEGYRTWSQNVVLRAADRGCGTSINGADTTVFKNKNWLKLRVGWFRRVGEAAERGPETSF